MKRNKRHKVKIESNESTIPDRTFTNTVQDRDLDLAHYIHDRVELLQRAFGAIKPRELKAMTPACVAGLSFDDLQELCLEELLGISSVRLCAILDGAEPPSDTDSSESSEAISAVHLETISLDSISSDEDTLNPPPAAPPQETKSGKPKKRCRRKEARKAKTEVGNDESQSRTHAAERAGMTVLELLELQARARAIRAQLAMEHTHVTTTDTAPRKGDESDNDVQIKEEPPEVVELSSDDEDESHHIAQSSACSIANEIHKDKSNTTRSSLVQSKGKCELTVIVPNTQSKKIKLKRNKTTAIATPESTNLQKNDIHEDNISPTVKMKVIESVSDEPVSKLKGNEIHNDKIEERDCHNKKDRIRLGKQKKKKRDKNKPGINREVSDHDEILLQLSDTEKMDLLEDFDRKNLDNTSSSESDASTDVGISAETSATVGSMEFINNDKDSNINLSDRQLESQGNYSKHTNNCAEMYKHNEQSVEVEQIESENNPLLTNKDVKLSLDFSNEAGTQALVLNIHSKGQESEFDSKNTDEEKKIIKPFNSHENQVNLDQHQEISQVNDMSEGEISDRSSSEVKMKDINRTISTIGSETLVDKEEKSNSDRKSKQLDSNNHTVDSPVKSDKQTDVNNVCEILEISDDSSCYEEEGVSVLSKEPTTEEIEAFSARIDHEIQREELTTGEEGNKDLENISWKHRYLDSKKVKKIMSTANILNALRKKNKELKRKIEESKNKTDNEDADDINESPLIEEGTVDQYNTLEGSTKYVSPPPVSLATEDSAKHLHKEMKKDAKQLLKMYKRLLKYNDMQKEPRKSKSKKKKHKKEKEKTT